MRIVCPELCVFEFKYSAAPTRRTTVTTVETSLCPEIEPDSMSEHSTSSARGPEERRVTT